MYCYIYFIDICVFYQWFINIQLTITLFAVVPTPEDQYSLINWKSFVMSLRLTVYGSIMHTQDQFFNQKVLLSLSNVSFNVSIHFAPTLSLFLTIVVLISFMLHPICGWAFGALTNFSLKGWACSTAIFCLSWSSFWGFLSCLYYSFSLLSSSTSSCISFISFAICYCFF